MVAPFSITMKPKALSHREPLQFQSPMRWQRCVGRSACGTVPTAYLGCNCPSSTASDPARGADINQRAAALFIFVEKNTPGGNCPRRTALARQNICRQFASFTWLSNSGCPHENSSDSRWWQHAGLQGNIFGFFVVDGHGLFAHHVPASAHPP